MVMLRQGDILLVSTDSIPPDAIEITPAGSRVFLAASDRSGQSHGVPASAVRLYAVYPVPFDYLRPKERYLRVLCNCALEHDEHDPLPLSPGLYRVVMQRRMDHSRWLDVAD